MIYVKKILKQKYKRTREKTMMGTFTNFNEVTNIEERKKKTRMVIGWSFTNFNGFSNQLSGLITNELFIRFWCFLSSSATKQTKKLGWQ